MGAEPVNMQAVFSQLSARSHVPMLLLGDQGRVEAANAAFGLLLGQPLPTIQGSDIADWVADSCAARKLLAMLSCDHKPDRMRWLEVPFRTRGGKGVVTRVSCGQFPDIGHPTERIVYVEVTRSGMREGASGDGLDLAGDTGLAARLLEAADQAVLVVDTRGVIRFANAGAKHLFAAETAGLTGISAGDVLTRRPDVSDDDGLLATLLLPEEASDTQCWARRLNGGGFNAALSMSRLSWQGEPLVALWVRDISEEKRREAQIAYLTHYDAVTGLPNRNLFLDRLTQAVKRGNRIGHAVVLMCIDLDAFTRVNEGFGHELGDELLCEVASRIGGALRVPDTLARTGGDEFAAVLEGDAAMINAGQMAEDILHLLAEPIYLGGKPIALTASIGISFYPKQSDSAEALFRHGQAAMRQAKRLGGHNHCFYAGESAERSVESLSMASQLRRALAEDQFLLHYQPIVRLSDAAIVGVEALLRWQHPTRGLLLPAAFLAELDAAGMAMSTAEWVLNRALGDMAVLQQCGEELQLSVNIASQLFRQGQLVDLVRGSLGRFDLKPGSLQLEITESALLTREQDVAPMLEELDALGVLLAADDFGTGYSSLVHLKRYPIDVLKIDKSFIDGLPNNKRDAAIVGAMLSLAHQLNMKVVAEGVETDAQRDFLSAWQGALGQGFLFSPAISFEALKQTLKARQARSLSA